MLSGQWESLVIHLNALKEVSFPSHSIPLSVSYVGFSSATCFRWSVAFTAEGWDSGGGRIEKIFSNLVYYLHVPCLSEYKPLAFISALLHEMVSLWEDVFFTVIHFSLYDYSPGIFWSSSYVHNRRWKKAFWCRTTLVYGMNTTKKRELLLNGNLFDSFRFLSSRIFRGLRFTHDA